MSPTSRLNIDDLSLPTLFREETIVRQVSPVAAEKTPHAARQSVDTIDLSNGLGTKRRLWSAAWEDSLVDAGADREDHSDRTVG